MTWLLFLVALMMIVSLGITFGHIGKISDGLGRFIHVRHRLHARYHRPLRHARVEAIEHKISSRLELLKLSVLVQTGLMVGAIIAGALALGRTRIAPAGSDTIVSGVPLDSLAVSVTGIFVVSACILMILYFFFSWYISDSKEMQKRATRQFWLVMLATVALAMIGWGVQIKTSASGKPPAVILPKVSGPQVNVLDGFVLGAEDVYGPAISIVYFENDKFDASEIPGVKENLAGLRDVLQACSSDRRRVKLMVFGATSSAEYPFANTDRNIRLSTARATSVARLLGRDDADSRIEVEIVQVEDPDGLVTRRWINDKASTTAAKAVLEQMNRIAYVRLADPAECNFPR